MKITTDRNDFSKIQKTMKWDEDEDIVIVGVVSGTKVDEFAIIFDEGLGEAGLCTFRGDIFALRKNIRTADQALDWAEQLISVLGVKR